MVESRFHKLLSASCSHDQGFVLTTSFNIGANYHRPIFLCKKCESYWLNFDPKKFPNGTTYLEVTKMHLSWKESMRRGGNEAPAST